MGHASLSRSRAAYEMESTCQRQGAQCSHMVRQPIEHLQHCRRSSQALRCIRAVMDAFTFAENEGLDPTMSGRLNMSTIKAAVQ